MIYWAVFWLTLVVTLQPVNGWKVIKVIGTQTVALICIINPYYITIRSKYTQNLQSLSLHFIGLN